MYNFPYKDLFVVDDDYVNVNSAYSTSGQLMQDSWDRVIKMLTNLQSSGVIKGEFATSLENLASDYSSTVATRISDTASTVATDMTNYPLAIDEADSVLYGDHHIYEDHF